MIKRIIAIALVCAALALAMTSCTFQSGEVSERDFRIATQFPDELSLSGFTQTAYNEKGDVLYSFAVTFDKNTLYRIERGADGLVDYELYIQYADREYTQYKNDYSEAGEMGSWKKSKIKSEVWDANIQFLFGLDDDYGLEEFLYYEDFTFDAKKGVYYSEEPNVIYDGLYFTDVTVRFEGKRIVEFNFTQNAKQNKIKLEQTFQYDGGEIDVPEKITN